MSTILSLLILAFFILLVVGIFSPTKSLFWHKGNRTRKKSALIYGLAILAGIMLFNATLPPEEKAKMKADRVAAKADKAKSETLISGNNGQQENGANAQSTIETKTIDYNKIGDQIEVGNFTYKVNGIKFAKSVGNEFTRKTADGIYLIANVTFRNNDNEEHTLDNSFFKLTDENGTEFQSSTDGETALEMSGQETLFLKQCNPQITKSGLLIFEVPNKKVYDLHLSGGFWNGKTAVVKLTQ
ncbi:MAG: DUF4352 domain-containing protein [Chitinophagaceae bacterium]|nr:DUF4352 domain-containing protein [Chitinophagaceae bacterium]